MKRPLWPFSQVSIFCTSSIRVVGSFDFFCCLLDSTDAVDCFEFAFYFVVLPSRTVVHQLLLEATLSREQWILQI